MAYDGSKLSLISGPLTGKGKVFHYETTDAAATVDTSGYFADGVDRGMVVGDLVVVNDTNTPLITTHLVADVNTTTKVADVGAGSTVGSGTDAD